MKTVRFMTEACGRPRGADSIPWVRESVFYRFRTPRHGDAVRWEGEVEAEMVEELGEFVTWGGVGYATRYRLEDGKTFVWRYVPGSPESPDFAVIVMEG